MRNIWFLGDLHLGHTNILTFQDAQHDRTRPFDTIEEHDATIEENWNKDIKTEDYVYVVGDIAFDKEKFQKQFPRLNGSKRLIIGNHDDIKKFDMTGYFKKINLWRVFREYDFTVTHIPMHMDFCKTTFNVHGHIHQNISPDPRHINVSLEQTGFKPVHLDEIISEIARRKDIIERCPKRMIEACRPWEWDKVIIKAATQRKIEPDQSVAEYRGRLLRDVMAQSEGKANPQTVNDVLNVLFPDDYRRTSRV